MPTLDELLALKEAQKGAIPMGGGQPVDKGGNFMTGLAAPQPTLEQNFDQQFGQAPQPQQQLPQPQMPQAQPAPVKEDRGFLGTRKSLLSIVGGLGDVFARIGGAPVQYQPQVDARDAKVRQNHLDGQNDETHAGQIAQNNVDVAKGQFDLSTAQHALVGQAANGLASVFQRGEAAGPGGGAAAVQKAWPMLVQQLGIPPEQAAQFGQALAADPQGTISALQGALNKPAAQGAAQGAESADTQFYNLLKENGHSDLADKFLEHKVNGMPLSEKDAASLAIKNQQLGINRGRANAYTASTAGGGAGGSGGLTSDALRYAAADYRQTGKLPALGGGNAGKAVRTAIINEAARQSQGGAEHDDPATFRANFKANASGLTKLSNVSSLILASEKLANNNADLVLQTMGKGGGPSGSPVLNRWIQAGRKEVQGDPDVSRFNTSVKTFATEYARVMSGASGGTLTNQMQNHAMDMINTNMGVPALRATISQMKREMENRRTSFSQQAAELRSSMRLPGAHSPSSAGGNLPTMTPEQVRAAPKGTRFRTADGRTGIRP
jgi:hypothetical protein